MGILSGNPDCNFVIQGNATTGNSRLFFGDTDEDVGAIKYSHVNDEMDFRVNATDIIKADSTGVRIQPNGVVTASVGTFEVIQGAPATISPTANAVSFWFQTNAVVEIVASPASNSFLRLGNFNDPTEAYVIYQNSTERMLIGTGAENRILLSTYGLNLGRNVASEPVAMLEVTQGNVPKPVVKLTQQATIYPFHHFSGTTNDTGLWDEANLVSYSSGAGPTAANTYTILGFARAQITDANGKIKNGYFYVPFCTISNT
jgi:hypothetical protein